MRHKIDMRGFRITTDPNDFKPDVDAAVIQLNDTNRGVLLNTLTSAQRDAIANPVTGLLIFNTDTNQFEYYLTSTSLWTSQAIDSSETELVYSSTITWDLDTNPIAKVTLTGSPTITVTGGTSGGAYRLAIIQGVGAPYTPTIDGVDVRGPVDWEVTENSINILSVDIVDTTIIGTVI